MIIDIHTHAFPPELAQRAIPQLEQAGGFKAHLGGSIEELLASMDRAGISLSVIASIATLPGQFNPILNWSRTIASDRILPLISVHPDDPLAAERIRQVRNEGFAGLKMHSYYQNFELDAPRMQAFYETVEECGLVILFHCGFDCAYPRNDMCGPVRVGNLARRHPNLKFIAAHLGGWQDWTAAQEHVLGRPIYLDISSTLEYMPAEKARQLLLSHPAEYLIFGSDSPWADQTKAVAQLRALDLGAEVEEAILGGNARRLLSSVFGQLPGDRA